jgi:hypothetical protein
MKDQPLCIEPTNIFLQELEDLHLGYVAQVAGRSPEELAAHPEIYAEYLRTAQDTLTRHRLSLGIAMR